MANLFNSDAGLVAVIALAAAAIALLGMAVLLVRQQRLLSRYRDFMQGATGASLEQLLHEHVAQLGETAEQVQSLERMTRRLEQEALSYIHRVAVVRYNPFRDTGGDQSFAIALADGQGNGVVLSSLHARDVTRVYAKPLENWKSTYALTDEEKWVIALASQRESS